MPKKAPTKETLARREKIIKTTALNIIKNNMTSALTMDQVVNSSPYSKGTIYNHFTCKEDLIISLANDANLKLKKLLLKKDTPNIGTRERILNIGTEYLKFSIEEPTYHRLMMHESSGYFRDKSSDKHKTDHLNSGNSILRIILDVINLAIANGDLNPVPHRTPEQIAFTLWSISFGTILLMHDSPEDCCVRGHLSMENEYISQYNLVLDALNWK